jgi:hypothetical protein
MIKLGEPARQLEFMHESRLVTRRTSQKCPEQTRVQTRPTLLISGDKPMPVDIVSLYLALSRTSKREIKSQHCRDEFVLSIPEAWL